MRQLEQRARSEQWARRRCVYGTFTAILQKKEEEEVYLYDDPIRTPKRMWIVLCERCW